MNDGDTYHINNRNSQRIFYAALKIILYEENKKISVLSNKFILSFLSLDLCVFVAGEWETMKIHYQKCDFGK